VHTLDVIRALAVVTAVAVVGVVGHAGFGASLPENGVIAFSGGLGDTCTCIYVVNPDGSGLRLLIARAQDPAWSPDGTKLAFAKGVGVADLAIWVANADGTNAHPLHAATGPYYQDEPSWSPDGTKIAYTSANYHTGQTYIGVARADGTAEAGFPVPAWLTLDGRNPEWSPDGARIAFNRSFLTNGGLFLNTNVMVMNADGSGVQLLATGGPFPASNAAWTPDGGIVYTLQVGPASRVVFQQVPLSSPLVVLGQGSDPASSPDGRRVAFVTHAGQLAVVDRDGTNTTLVETSISSRGPAWQPALVPAPGGTPSPPSSPVPCEFVDGACVVDPHRDGYCAPNGRFLDLIAGQPSRDPAYRDAVPAAYVPGIGLTCDRPYFPYPVGSPFGSRP
jgi:dipeptidyl aminopeptidase/acylaminoacyl peptidase